MPLEIPTHYNIAEDCVDRYARFLQTRDQRALTHVRVIKNGQFAEQGLSFGNLSRLTNRMANALRGLGLQPGQRILLRLPNGPEFPVAFLGAVKAGLIPIPSSPALKWPEMSLLLEDSQAAAIVTDVGLRPSELTSVDAHALCKIVVAQPDEIMAGEHRFAELIKNSSSDFKSSPRGRTILPIGCTPVGPKVNRRRLSMPIAAYRPMTNGCGFGRI